MSHVHVAGQIEYRGKVDSVYIVCMYCDHVEYVGVWFVKTPKGWSKNIGLNYMLLFVYIWILC